MKKVITIGILLLMFSCSKKPQGITAVDIQGHTYRLVSEGKKMGNGFSEPELWEKIDPPNTNYWYTPSLESQVHTNSTKTFVSILRQPK